MAKNQHIGSSLDGLLEETGELTEISTVAIKRVIAWEISRKNGRREIIQNKNGGAYDGYQPLCA